MSYFIYRNQQQYGPYTLQDLQSQIAGGTMVAADQARNAQGGPWTTVGDILAQASQGLVPPAAPAYPVAPSYPGAVGVSTVPLPPNLHWAILLLIGIVFNPFTLGWQIYQMIWIRKIDKESKALLYFGLAFGSFLVLFIIGVAIVAQNTQNPNPFGFVVMALGFLSLVVFFVLCNFDIRRSMVTYYNTVEPIGLRLSGVMTFFFNVYYFQHHMSRIANWKLTGYLTPQS
jgi:hypothetical protein